MKRVIFVLPGMRGGGAERVASLLANRLHDRGVDVSCLLTHARNDEVKKCDLDEEIPLILIKEKNSKHFLRTFVAKLARVYSSAICKLFEKAGRQAPVHFAYVSFWSEYHNEIRELRNILQSKPDLAIIAFLQPAIPITLLAAQGLPNKVIISERADPERILKKRYGVKFIKKYYPRADAAVFQTENAMAAYPEEVSSKGTVIPNPLKPGLPEPYHGERSRTITTFCRLSHVKDLPTMLAAFKLLHDSHPDYTLRIIGDASDEAGKRIRAELDEYILQNSLSGSVSFEPFDPDIHKKIMRDAMYVNSSYTEGLCNAMLEALAIGMPSVCTDCPIGGARATITDGENGLLVPIRDPEALCLAMERVIEEPGLADKLSLNAAKLRDELDIDSITDRWMKLL